MDKKKIIIVVAVLIVIGGLVWFFSRNDEGGSVGQQVSTLDAVDTVGNFYDQWLKAIKEPTTADPNRVTLMKSPLLSKELRDRLAKESTLGASPDPVLCTTKTPDKITTSRVFEQADAAQLLVMSREKNASEAAIVTLAKDGGWYIDTIECTKGDIPPVREFAFEKEGNLLKGSIPKPFDPKNWHLVFEDNGVKGNVVPLFFDATSQCTSLEGVKAVCKPAEFKEIAKVSVQAQMTERGATVKNLKFIK
ncbi:MAG: hypothetical protein AAB719_00995 [Patescibacteria group bacterium]